MREKASPSAAEIGPLPTENWVLRWNQQDPMPSPPTGNPWPKGSITRTPDGGWVAVIGHLLDRGPLSRKLGLPGDASSAELVAVAFARWGDDAPLHLYGSWLLMVWQPKQERLLVVRDPMGLQPAYYRFDGRTLLLSSSLPSLMQEPEISRRVRSEAVAEFLALRFPTQSIHETFLADVDRIPASHLLRLCRGRLTLERWWEPLPQGFAWCTPEELATFPEVLGRAVKRVLDAGADSIALSGGFDSVGLAAIAARQLEGHAPLHAASLRFPGEAIDEAATQRSVASALSMPQSLVELGDGLKGQNLLEAALDLRYESPSPVLGIWNSLYTMLFERAHAAGCRHMIFGTGGDEMLALDFSHATDCLRGFRLPELGTYLRAVQRTSPFGAAKMAKLVLIDTALKGVVQRSAADLLGAVSPGALRSVRRWRARRQVPDWIRHGDPALVKALKERVESPTPLSRAKDAVYVDRMRRLTQAPVMHMEFDQAAAWAQSLGLTACYPYFDRDVVSLSLRMNPRDLIAAGRMKSPLRDLVGKLLPDVEMPPRKVDFTALMHEILRTHGPATWKRLGGASRLAELGVVSPSHLNRMWRDYLSGKRGDALRPWLVLSTETWLRKWEH